MCWPEGRHVIIGQIVTATRGRRFVLGRIQAKASPVKWATQGFVCLYNVVARGDGWAVIPLGEVT